MVLIKKLFIIVMVLTLTGCHSLVSIPIKPMFRGMPNYSSLDSSVIKNSIFSHAPKPSIAIIDYESINLATKRKYSNYQVRLDKKIQKLTSYRTTELTGKNKQLYGYGISYGGILPIGYLKRGTLINKNRYFMRYQLMSISNVNGNLFPLQVGNFLSFHYINKEQHEYKTAPVRKVEGIIQYKIIGKLKKYYNGITRILGPIYIIKVNKSIGHGRLKTDRIYYFSQRLGWYVDAIYYTNNKPVSEYRVVNYQY